MNAKELAALVKSGSRPAGMTFPLYAALLQKAGLRPISKSAYLSKAEEEEEEDDEDEDMDDDDDDSEEEEESEKSMRVSANALRKSIRSYETVEDAIDTGTGDRMGYLQGRLDNDLITKSERRELAALIADDDDEPMRKSMHERIGDQDPDSKKLVSANAFLTSLVDSVDASLEAVQSQIATETSGTRQLIKSQGSLIKSLSAVTVQLAGVVDELRSRLSEVEATPVGPRAIRTPRRGAVTGRGLAKSVNGGDRDERLSKSQILSGLDRLVAAAAQKGDTAALNALTHATAKVETTGQISAQHYDAVMQALGGNN